MTIERIRSRAEVEGHDTAAVVVPYAETLFPHPVAAPETETVVDPVSGQPHKVRVVEEQA